MITRIPGRARQSSARRGLIARIQSLGDLVNRGIIINSVTLKGEKQPDGRVQLKLKK